MEQNVIPRGDCVMSLLGISLSYFPLPRYNLLFPDDMAVRLYFQHHGYLPLFLQQQHLIVQNQYSISHFPLSEV